MGNKDKKKEKKSENRMGDFMAKRQTAARDSEAEKKKNDEEK